VLEGGAELELAAWYFKSKDDAAGAFNQLQPTSTGAVFGPLIGGGRISSDPDLVYNDFPVNWSTRQAGAHFKLRVPFEKFDLVSLTGYQDWLTPSGVDFDATDAPIAFFFSDSKTRTASQEIQLVSTQGAVQWVAGLFYFDNRGSFAPLNIPAGMSPPLTVSGPLTSISAGSQAQASALFAQASYAFGAADAWRATVGGRYSREKATLDPAAIAVTGLGVVANFPGTDVTWDDFSPKLTLDYSTDNSLTYLTVSRGFKSGAFNLASPGDLSPVEPEKLTAVELGYKLTFAEGRARFELAAFSYRYKQLQVQFITNQTAPLTLGNAEKATSRGMELSIVGKPTARLQLTAGLAWLQKAEYDTFGTTLPNGSVVNGGVAYADNGAGNSSGIANFSGNVLAHAPETSGNLGVVYDVPLANGSLSLSGNLYHSSEYFFSAQNSARARQGAYTTLNARATWKDADDRWRVSLWGNNITDETYFSQILVNALGTFGQFGARRTFGIELGYSLR
jgi:iron complex outermembrane receptor protein